MGMVLKTRKNEVCWLTFALGNYFIQTNRLSLNACLLCAKGSGEEASEPHGEMQEILVPASSTASWQHSSLLPMLSNFLAEVVLVG